MVHFWKHVYNVKVLWIKCRLSVCQSVTQSSPNWFISFFLFFCIKLRDHKRRKVTEPKSRVFGLLRKIESLVFARNDLKWRVLWFPNYMRKSHIWENSRSRDLGQNGPKKGKNRVFGLLRKMPIYNTTAKDFENLISYLNSWWKCTFRLMWQYFLYLHSFTPKNGCIVVRVFGLLRKIESLVLARNGLKLSVLWLVNFLCKSHIWENSRSRDLGPKVGGAVGKNLLFCILLKIVSLDFLIFCMKLKGIKGYKLPQMLFLGKFLFADFGYIWWFLSISKKKFKVSLNVGPIYK